jgi:hypothetical protein
MHEQALIRWRLKSLPGSFSSAIALVNNRMRSSFYVQARLQCEIVLNPSDESRLNRVRITGQ